jgi:uncharacterized membrane protein YhaH (DUF805 family)
MDLINLFFSFEGRISRKSYWLYCALPTIIVSFYVEFAHIYFSLPEKLFLILIFLWPNLAIHVKRWHDQDKSGWWHLICFVPYIGFLVAIIMCGFVKGSQGRNRFGDSPLQNLTHHSSGTPDGAP